MAREKIQLPFGFNILLIAFGALVLGAHAATGYIAPLPAQIAEPETRVITKKVHGTIITLPGGTRVIRVQQLVVHTDHVIIHVPAQTLPVTGVGATLRAHANVPVTVTVNVPVGGGNAETTFSGSVSVSTVTETSEPSTVTVTLPPVTITVPTTVTVPEITTPTTSDQEGNP